MMNDAHRHYAEPQSTVISMQFSTSQKLIYGERMQNEAEGEEGDGGTSGNFPDDENVLYLAFGDSFKDVDNCQNLSNGKPKPKIIAPCCVLIIS